MRRPGDPVSQSVNKRKEDERLLKQKLLNGELIHHQDDAAAESLRYLQRQSATGHHLRIQPRAAGGFDAAAPHETGAHPDGHLDLSSTGMPASHGPLSGDSVSGPSVAHSKELMERAKTVAHEATSKLGLRKGVSEEDREKAEEGIYAAYEKLHSEQEELELARKEMGVDRFEGNFLAIENALQAQPEGLAKPNEAVMGDWATYDRVKQMLNTFVFRRNPGAGAGGVDAGHPQYLEALKAKLNDAREQIDLLRRRVKDQQSALKASVMESRSAQALLVDRNEDLGRLRKEVSTLQLQLRHYKHTRKGSVAHGAQYGSAAPPPGSKEDLMLQIDQLRSDFDTLADANWQLQQDNKMLRLKLEFRPRRMAGDGDQDALQRHGSNTSSSNAASGSPLGSMPKIDSRDSKARSKLLTEDLGESSGALLRLKSTRKKWAACASASESTVMELLDFDADSPLLRSGVAGSTKPGSAVSISVRGASRGGEDALQGGNLNVASRSRALSPAGGSDAGAPTSRPPSSREPPPRAGAGSPKLALGSGSPFQHSLPSPKGSMWKSGTPATPQPGTTLEEEPGWKATGAAWTVLRQKVLTAVACSRAEVLRREDAHIRRMRHRIQMLSNDLSLACGDRDVAVEKLGRAEAETLKAKEDTALAVQKIATLEAAVEQLKAEQSVQILQPSLGYFSHAGAGDGHHRVRFASPDDGDRTSQSAPQASAAFDPSDATDSSAVRIGNANMAGDAFLLRARTLVAKRREADAAMGVEQLEKRNSELESQLDVMRDIFDSKVQRLEDDLRAKTKQLDDTMRLLQQSSSTSAHPVPAVEDAATKASSGAAEAITIKRLERAVIKKDQELHNRDVELKKMRVRFEAAQDIINEERAVVNLGLGKRAAARVVAVLRRRLHRARETLGLAMLEAAEREAVQGGLDGHSTHALQTTTGAHTSAMHTHQSSTDGGARSGVRGIRAEDIAFQRNAAVAEEADEELAILEQMMKLTKNPAQKEHISRQISLLELADESEFSHIGNAIAKRETEWSITRQLWLRLITVREQQWQNAMTEEMRKKYELRLIDTYEAFLRFEQNDNSEARPSIASNGAMRVVSMAASPISQEGGLRSFEEVEREYIALMELVRSRTNQLLQLEAERDEILARIEQLSNRQGSKKATLPPSALIVRHIVGSEETSTNVAGRYGITNMQMVRELFHQGQRAANDAFLPGGVYVPIKTLNALNIVFDAFPATVLIVRRLVQPSDTIGSIAALLNVTPDKVCRVGTLSSLMGSSGASAAEVVGGAAKGPVSVPHTGHHQHQATVDVIVQKSTAAKYVLQLQPDVATEQVPITVLAFIPRDAITTRTVARHLNVDEEEIHILNAVLEEGAVLDIPLFITPFTAALVPSLIESKQIAVVHTVGMAETRCGIAERYGVREEDVLVVGETLRPRAQVHVLLPTVEQLLALIRDPCLISFLSTAVRQQQQEQQGMSDSGGKRQRNRTSSVVSLEGNEESNLGDDDGSFAPLSGLQRGRTLLIRGKAGASSFRKDDAAGSSGSPPKLSRRRSSLRRGSADAAASDHLSGGKYSAFLPADELPVIDHVVLESIELRDLAISYSCLREDIVVPNFSLLNSSTAEWLVRLRDFGAIATARESGMEVHCLIPVVEEPLHAISKELGVSEDMLIRSNEDVGLTKGEEPLTGHLRIPLLNNKVQALALRRSGEVYAVVSSRGQSVTSVARLYGVSEADVQAFNATLEPEITRNVIITKRNLAGSGREFRVTMRFHSDVIDITGTTAEQQSKIRAGFESDLLSIIDGAPSQDETRSDGEIRTVHCVDLGDSNIFTATVVCTTRGVAEQVLRIVKEDGPYSHLDATRTALVGLHDTKEKRENAEQRIPSVIPLVTFGERIFALSSTAEQCAIRHIGDGETLTHLSLAYGIGTDELLVCNPDLLVAALQPHPLDGTPESLAGLEELRTPAGGRSLLVEKGDTMNDMVKRARCSVAQLRSENLHLIPLRHFASCVRVPLPMLEQQSSMLVRNHAAESILAFATRLRCRLDQVYVDRVDVSVGAVLRIPPRCGATVSHSAAAAVHFCPKYREHLVHRGDNIEALAAQYGCFVKELIMQNAASVRLAPGSIASIPVRTSPQEMAEAQTSHVGFFVRHPVGAGETLASIASAYFQPLTTVMNINQALFNTRGAHLVLIPVGSEDRGEMLMAPMNNIFTIVVPGNFDTMGSLAKRFHVPLEKVKVVNELIGEEKRIIIPIASPTALSLVRQQNLMIFLSVELQPRETLVSVADRHNVFVKDLLVLGRPLLDVGIDSIDIPVSFDVAQKLLQSPQAKGDLLFYSTELGAAEALAFLAHDVGVAVEEVMLVHRGSIAKMPTTSKDTLANARTREVCRMVKRSEMVSQTLQIGHAIRKLNERNDATRRELEKVEAIRSQMLEQQRQTKAAATSGSNKRTINTDEIGTQTDLVEEREKKTRQRRNTAAQTRLMMKTVEYFERAAKDADTKQEALRSDLSFAKGEVECTKVELEELREKLHGVQQLLRVKEDRMHTLERMLASERALNSNSTSAPTPGGGGTPLTTPLSSTRNSISVPADAHPSPLLNTKSRAVQVGGGGESFAEDNSARQAPLSPSPPPIGSEIRTQTKTAPQRHFAPVKAVASDADALLADSQQRGKRKGSMIDVVMQTSLTPDTASVGLGTSLVLSSDSMRSEWHPTGAAPTGIQATSMQTSPVALSPQPPKTPPVSIRHTLETAASLGAKAEVEKATVGVQTTEPKTVMTPVVEESSLSSDGDGTAPAVEGGEGHVTRTAGRQRTGTKTPSAAAKERPGSTAAPAVADEPPRSNAIHAAAQSLARSAAVSRVQCDQLRLLFKAAMSTLWEALVAHLRGLTARVPEGLMHPSGSMVGLQNSKPDARAMTSLTKVTRQRSRTLNMLFEEARRNRHASLLHFRREQRRPSSTHKEDAMSSEDWLQRRLSEFVNQQLAGQASVGDPIDIENAPQDHPALCSLSSLNASGEPVLAGREARPAQVVAATGGRHHSNATPQSPAETARGRRPQTQPPSVTSTVPTLPPINAKKAFGDRSGSLSGVSGCEASGGESLQSRRSAAAQEESRVVERSAGASAVGTREMQKENERALALPASELADSASINRAALKGAYEGLQLQLLSFVDSEANARRAEEEASAGGAERGAATGAFVSSEVADEVLPVLTVMDELKRTEMSPEQQYQVKEIRARDRKLRKEAVQMAIRTLQTRIRIQRIMDTYGTLKTATDRDEVLKITSLWRGWIKQWAVRRRRIERDRRHNLQRLIGIFVMLEEDFLLQQQAVAGRSPTYTSTAYTSSRAAGGPPFRAGSPPDVHRGVVVLQKHRPGSKFVAMQLPLGGDSSPSSKHFSQVDFTAPPPPDVDLE